MNASTWIVIANASKARFFSQQSRSSELEEINDMVNEAVRLRTRELESDSMGPTSAGKSIHNVGGATPNKTYQPNQMPEQHQAELFARSVIDFLQRAQQEGRFQHLCLFASPQFLGTLRKLMSSQLQSSIRLEVNKDYTLLSAAEIHEELQSHKANA
jgi:protein required for attachment to host cells